MPKDSWGDIIPFPLARRVARPPIEPAIEEIVTFGELASEWLLTYGAELVEPKNARRHIDHLRPLWTLTQKELRPSAIKRALAGLAETLGGATINKVRSTGRKIIQDSTIDDRWTGPNPFSVVHRHKQIKIKPRKLTLAEVRSLLPHLRADRRLEALFMLYLGSRPGEMKALQRVDVDFTGGLVLIRRSNGRDQTKTGKERIVPMPLGLRPALEEALSESPPGCELVFPAKGGRRQRNDAKLSRMLKEGLRKAGLVTGYRHICRRRGCLHRENKQAAEGGDCPKCGFKFLVLGIPIGVRFYDLRHSAATLHREAGADPLAIQLALGHAPENLTDSTYTHLSLDDIRRELSKLTI